MKIARKFAVAGGVTALVLGAGMGGLALADIPDSDDGEFHACVSNGGGQVRLIDKEDGASCHSYETEKVWKGGSDAFTPKLTKQFWAMPGSNTVRTLNCPSGQKLVNAHAGYRLDLAGTQHWPGQGTSGVAGEFNDAYASAVYEYVVDANGVLTGAQFMHTLAGDLEAVIVCSP